MFPLHQGNELCFQISSNSQHHQKISQDLILQSHPSATLFPYTSESENMGKSRRRKLVSSNDETETANNNNDKKKKLMHRDIERQRRQEMATLYASLRSLLPLQYIKGKRSISDHMNEAVNYIKQLQKRIKELEVKRDELKQQTTNLPAIASQTSSGSCTNSEVIIRPCLGGIEIVFSTSTGLIQQGLTLSRVLQVLLEEEISVVNCFSTKINERVFHTLQAEVKDPSCLNLSGLEQKLTSL